MNGCASHTFSAQRKNNIKRREIPFQYTTNTPFGAPFQSNTKTAVECHSAHSSCRPSYSLELLKLNHTFDIFPAF